MTSPTCPQDYTCNFTLNHPRVIFHETGPWWQHAWGVVIAVIAVILLACIVAYVVMTISDTHNARMNRLEAARQRSHDLEIEQQRTYQADMAKGDVEFLRTLRS